MAAGIPGTGAAGLILAIQVISSRQVVGIMLFTAGECSRCSQSPDLVHVGILWIILALLDLYLIKKVLQLYRSTGQVPLTRHLVQFILMCDNRVWKRWKTSGRRNAIKESTTLPPQTWARLPSLGQYEAPLLVPPPQMVQAGKYRNRHVWYILCFSIKHSRCAPTVPQVRVMRPLFLGACRRARHRNCRSNLGIRGFILGEERT